MRVKSLLVTAAALMVAVGVQAQGTLVFGNSGSSSPVLLSDGATKAWTGNANIWVGLFVSTVTATPDSSMGADLSGWNFSPTAIHVTPIQAAAGAYSGGTRTINGIAGGTQVRAQVRVWSAAVGTTTFSSDYAGYLAALDYGGTHENSVLWGYQAVPNLLTLGTPPAAPPTLTGAGILPVTLAFVPATIIVPEPSLLALGLLGGLGTLVLIRRRK